MIRALRWVLLLAVLGGAVYMMVGVDFGGATLLDRILGRGAASQSPAARPTQADAGLDDRLTDEDRRGLDRLLESKMQEKQQGREGP